MRISSLQIALAIAGALFVAGVIVYNHWVLRRARGRSPAPAAARGDGDERIAPRVEPSLRGSEAGSAEPPSSTGMGTDSPDANGSSGFAADATAGHATPSRFEGDAARYERDAARFDASSPGFDASPPPADASPPPADADSPAYNSASPRATSPQGAAGSPGTAGAAPGSPAHTAFDAASATYDAAAKRAGTADADGGRGRRESLGSGPGADDVAHDGTTRLPALPVVRREAQDIAIDRRDTTLAQADPDIESVVALKPTAPVGVNALAAGLHARLGKPLRWFGRRDERAPWQRLHAETSGEYAEVVACLLLADRNGAATRNQLESFLRLLREIAPTLPATASLPSVDDELARAEALDKLCAELDMQIGITLQKADGSTIAGTRLRGVAEAAGFRLAPNGRFEWVQEETGNVVYTMQTPDGVAFTLEQLRAAALPGVVFVLDVPCVADPSRAFDQMRLAATRLAHTLGAAMVDDNRRPLDEPALARTRAAVARAAAALAEVHIEPGSPRALKLFSA